MKIIYYLVLVVFFFSSCDSNEYEPTDLAVQQIDSTIFKVQGDNLYDLLGYPFDATEEYLDISINRPQVIDIVELNKVGLVLSSNPVRSEAKIYMGSNLKEFTRQFDSKFSATLPIPDTPFKGTLSAHFNENSTVTTKFSYANVRMNCYVSHHEIKKYTPISTLQQYLTDNFKLDILTKTPEEIIGLYGTHVYTDIHTGGSVVFIHRAYVNNSNKKKSIGFGAAVTAIDATSKKDDNSNSHIVDVNANLDITNTAKSEFFQAKTTYKTRGGTGASIFGEWKEGSQPVILFNQWSSTISKDKPLSLQLIDVGDNSLIPLDEFVADPVKKAALRTAIINYLENKGRLNLLPVVPLYRYLSSGNNTLNHHYTKEINELGETGNSVWTYEGIEAFIFDNQESNTVPLYRFVKNVTIKTGWFSSKVVVNHYFTRDFNSGVSNGYKYEGVAGYVYTTPINGSIPLYQLYHPTKFDHLYTTTPQNAILENLSGYGSRTVCCYVFPGTRDINSPD